MLRLFRVNSPLNYLIAFFIMLLLWAYKFIFMPTAVDTGGMQSFFFRLHYESMAYQYIFTGFAFLTAFGFACYLARSNFNNIVVASAYQLPTLFYVILTGVAINAQRYIPEFFASIFISLAVLEMFKAYNCKDALRESLNVGLFTAIAVIFAHKFIYLLPILFVVHLLVNIVTWRGIAAFLISFVTCLAIACCFVWLYGDFNNLLMSIKDEFGKIVVGEKYNITNLLIHVPLFFVAVVAFISFLTLRTSKRTSESHFQTVMFILLLYYLALIISPLLSNEAIWLTFFPLSFLLTNIAVNVRKQRIANLLFYSIILLIAVSQAIQKIYFDTIF